MALAAARARQGPAIVVDHLTETYRLYHQRPTGLRERLTNPWRRATWTDFDALDDVSFTVEHGECVGVLGPNGSGKSTLLKVLARILPPDGGTVDTRGRVASLLELGAGFHDDLTGRENIYLNGAILGLSRGGIERQFDDIVDFAGVRDFLDQPVRSYSSGMYVRLGFAIAVHVDPDILLVDEVVSVGDATFQVASLERMASFRDGGRTVVLVSHDLGVLRALCSRVLVLERGRLIFDGSAREGISHYAQLTSSGHDRRVARGWSRNGEGDVRILDARLTDRDGVRVRRVAPSSPLVVQVRLRAERDIDACSAGIAVELGNGNPIYEVTSSWRGLGIGPLARGQNATVEFRIAAHVLAGHYRVQPVLTDPSGRRLLDVLPEPLVFEVAPTPGGAGLVDLEASMAVVEGPSLRLDGGALDVGSAG